MLLIKLLFIIVFHNFWFHFVGFIPIGDTLKRRGVTKNHIVAAKLSQVLATSSGSFSSFMWSPNMALEKAP